MPRLGLGSNITGGTVPETPFVNEYSLDFDGGDDIVEVQDASAWGGVGDGDGVDFTLACWIKADQDDWHHYISSAETDAKPVVKFGYSRNDNALYLNLIGADPGGSLIVSATGTADPHADGNWHHVAVVVIREGGASPANKGQFYIDGAVDGGTFNITGVDEDLFQTENTTRIGSALDTNWFNGGIDEVAMWDAALSADDMEKIYNSGVPTDLTSSSSYDTDRTSELKGYWRFTEGTGTSVEDLSGEGNTGTISGASWDADVPS